jgi:hypothetical protein
VRNNITSLDSFALRQCEWNRAHGEKQKQIKRASDEIRFNGGFILLFHFGFSLLESRFSDVQKLSFTSGITFLVRRTKKRQGFFLTIFGGLEQKDTNSFLRQKIALVFASPWQP